MNEKKECKRRPKEEMSMSDITTVKDERKKE